MEHNTYIDTIGIQVDLDCNKKQKEILSSIYIHLQKNSMLYIEYEDKIVNIGTKRIINREYYIRFKGKTFASIRTGSFRTGSYHKNDFQDMFYINITFAGLKSYNELLDEVSIATLFHVVGYLNTREIKFKLTELDIAIDTRCAFENILVLCVKKSSRTKYFTLTDRQPRVGTTYIERIDQKKLNSAYYRAYSYDKRKKEEEVRKNYLEYDITRFELKIQNRYFHKYGFDLNVIDNVLDKYYVMYFEEVNVKINKLQQLRALETRKLRDIRTSDYERIGLENYRIDPDMRYISGFIESLLNTYEEEPEEKANVEFEGMFNLYL